MESGVKSTGAENKVTPAGKALDRKLAQEGFLL